MAPAEGLNTLIRFSIHWVNLAPTVGQEIKKVRPVVILSPDEMNRHLGTVIVAPLTSTIRPYPFRLTIEVEGTKGQIALDQLRVIDKSRIVKPLSSLKKKYQDTLLALLQEMFSR